MRWLSSLGAGPGEEVDGDGGSIVFMLRLLPGLDGTEPRLSETKQPRAFFGNLPSRNCQLNHRIERASHYGSLWNDTQTDIIIAFYSS